MKRVVILLSMTFLVSSANAQIKSSKKAEPVETKPATIRLDSINLKGVYLSDTAKVSVMFLIEDGSIQWRKGYQIKTNFHLSQFNVLPYSQFLLDDKFKPFKKEEVEGIVDVKQFNWK